MKVAVIGNGYVGLVTGVSLATLGNVVICVGRNEAKTKQINSGKAPFYEPRLEPLLKKVIKKKKFSATTDLLTSVKSADIIIIAVGTPTVSKKIDLSAIEKASEQIGKAMKNVKKYQVVTVKSTVVPTTTKNIIGPIIEKNSEKKIGEFGLSMSPEFLREGQAVEDATVPDRVVIGGVDEKSTKTFAKLYAEVKTPKIFTDLNTAEMTKYAANALFATLISYSNEIARLCESIPGVDALDVWKGVHLDKRLSPIVRNKRITPGVISFILSGCGYGGSCFPKDTKALANFARKLQVETPIINDVISINETQPQRMIALLKNAIGSIKNKRIAVLGLSFKPETDDTRESPAFPIIASLKKEQAHIIAHDPVAYQNGKRKDLEQLGIILVKDPQDAIEHADAVLLITSWNEYKKIKPATFKEKMRHPVVIDGRRIYAKDEFIKAGIVYKGIGFTD